MIVPRSSHTFVLLLAALAFVGLPEASLANSHDEEMPAAAAFQCPESCTCSPVQIGQRELTHAHCQSADGLHDKNVPIHSLDMSGLGYAKVPATVEKLRNLTRLNLSNNHITEVARLSPRILDLDLGYNRIGSGKLSKLPLFLRKLNLTHNAITVVPSDLKKLEHLRELELAGNPINCSCETIQVRNWLQSRRVWTEDVIKCALPLQYKGRPWLQVKQSEVCHMTPAEIEEEKNIWEDSNDLMMGDAPAAGSGEGHAADHHDAIEDDYIPADEDPRAMPYGDEDVEDLDEGSGGHEVPPSHGDDHHSRAALNIEGSGFDPLLSSRADKVDTSTPGTGSDDEEEGSGVPIVPLIRLGEHIIKSHLPTDSDFVSEKDHSAPDHDVPIDEPEEEATREPVTGLGIFGKDVPAEVTESPIVKSEKGILNNAPVLPTGHIVGGAPGGTSLEDVEKAEKADSKKLYILLAIIVIVMVSLIIFVIIKQRNNRRRNNRRGQQDVENAKEQELQDMNNRLIGKPVGKNGNPESVPLMPGKEKWELAPSKGGDSEKIGFNPYQKPESPTNERQVPLRASNAVDEEVGDKKAAPELSSFRPDQRTDSKDSITENSNNNNNEEFNNQNNNQFHPIQNGYPQENGVSPASPLESPPSVHKAKRDEDWEKYTPKSPNLKRYSPVYSPETGRVKIKLTETPKPKTPLLVTRSRSNAGQIITTPNLNQRPVRTEAVVNGTSVEA